MKIKKIFIPIIIIILILIVGITILLTQQKNIYKFNFTNNYEPGSTYKGKINLSDGNTIIEVSIGCSLEDVNECKDLTDTYKGKIGESELKKVKKILSETNYEDSEQLIISITYLLDGDKICDDYTKQTCREIGIDLLDFIDIE